MKRPFQSLPALWLLLAIGAGIILWSGWRHWPEPTLEVPSVAAVEKGRTYQAKPNSSGYPFPTALPVFAEGCEGAFDWSRYIAESVSDGDKVFRAHLAFYHGFIAEELPDVMGVQESASDDAARNQIAADEVSRGCDLLETMYRKRLETDAELLAVLDQFIAYHKKAVEASIKLVGGSWDGGSGARVAYPAARLEALIHYRSALLDLRSSLHFQDMPQVAYPLPSKQDK